MEKSTIQEKLYLKKHPLSIIFNIGGREKIAFLASIKTYYIFFNPKIPSVSNFEIKVFVIVKCSEPLCAEPRGEE